MGKTLYVQQGDWQGLETSTKAVFLDFWAEWCGPCKMLSPTFEKLAETFGDQVTFAKINVDELPDIANRFSIRSIPTLILLKGGEEIERLVGLRSEHELAQVLGRHTNGVVKQ